MMMSEVFCARCGLAAPLDEPVKACVGCGWIVFVPARYLDWDAALTEKDKAFLKTNKIAAT